MRGFIPVCSTPDTRGQVPRAPDSSVASSLSHPPDSRGPSVGRMGHSELLSSPRVLGLRDRLEQDDLAAVQVYNSRFAPSYIYCNTWRAVSRGVVTQVDLIAIINIGCAPSSILRCFMLSRYPSRLVCADSMAWKHHGKYIL